MKLAIESGHCSDGDVFSIYGSAADVVRSMSALESFGGGIHVLYGPNWVINADEASLDLLKLSLGGMIRIKAEDEPPAPVELSRDDFKVGIKILEKKCFGSAGCNVSFRIVPEYVGVWPLPETGTVEITYEVKGGEGPLINTFTIEDGTAHYDSQERIGTSKSSAKLKAKVTDVAHYDW